MRKIICEDCKQTEIVPAEITIGEACGDGKIRCMHCWFVFKRKNSLAERKKQKPQHQGSLDEQLRLLIDVANREGLYDAADYLIGDLERSQRSLEMFKASFGAV